MTPILSPITCGAADIAAGMVGGLLGLAFGGVALLRGERPLHPDGITCAATVRTRGGGSSGVPWLDERGTTPVTRRPVGGTRAAKRFNEESELMSQASSSQP